MINNQLAENSVIQLLNSVKLARDNAERADNRVDHSFYYALTIALEELQERRKADTEPYGFTDGDRRGMIYKPEHADRLSEPVPVYRHAQPAPEYPETLPCPVLLEPGLRFSKGIKTSTMLAALARRAVHESDMAALSPEERVEFQARIEDFKALIAQPAPVVPDDVSIFEAAIEECKKCDSIDEHAWNHGVLAAIAKYESCRAAMLQELKKVQELKRSAGVTKMCRCCTPNLRRNPIAARRKTTSLRRKAQSITVIYQSANAQGARLLPESALN